MKIGVAIPHDPLTGHGVGPRAAAFQFVWDRLHRTHPEWVRASAESGRVVVVDDEPPQTVAWCKAEAVSAAIDGLDTQGCGVVVVHDADVVVAGDALRAAVAVVEDGAPWAMPHLNVHRLSDEATSRYMAGRAAGTLVRPPYKGVKGGGIVVVRRDVWETCPIDRRFVGWGSEDEAWGWALHALYGEPWRGDADLIHLWHPHAAPGARRSPRLDSERLWRAFRAYRNDAVKTRALIESGKLRYGLDRAVSRQDHDG
jgi:hypothetical protein